MEKPESPNSQTLVIFYEILDGFYIVVVALFLDNEMMIQPFIIKK